VIVDTSAFVAILYGEPEAESFLAHLHHADICRISAANYVELFIVVERQYGSAMAREAELLLKTAEVVIEPVTAEQGALAREAFLAFGRGRHEAGLNYGDCFSYALACAMGEPLLYKGNDFGLTDVGVTDH
jgi:ribonuclease VapC